MGSRGTRIISPQGATGDNGTLDLENGNISTPESYLPYDWGVETDYLDDTELPITTSLKEWVDNYRDMIETGDNGDDEVKAMTRAMGKYAANSSLNEKLRTGAELTDNEKEILAGMDKFTKSTTLTKETVLYSGLTEGSQLYNASAGSTITTKSFTSTSPDPKYAASYGVNTNTMIAIKAPKGSKIGVSVEDSSYTTEGVLARNTKIKIIKTYTKKVNGEKYKVLEAQLVN